MSLVLRWGRSAYETDAALSLERAGAESLGLSCLQLADREPPEALSRADVLVVPSVVRVDASVLARFAGRLVITTTSGHDHIDQAAAAARGVRIARLPEARRDPVVEHALTTLSWLRHRLDRLVPEAARGHWARGDLAAIGGRSLVGSTVAVVGVGVIGTRMARVLQALGVHVLGVDPAGVPEGIAAAGLEEALRACDAVTVHCSLTATSRGLLSGPVLDLLAPHAILVNTARGRVLDVRDAVQRVRDGRLGGLSVDVFPEEPWPELEAARVPGVLFTPHAAGYDLELGERVAKGLTETLRMWLEEGTVPYEVG